MNREFVIASVVLASAFLSGCTESTKTVDYYKQNTAARLEKVTECKNNPGELMRTPNCKNALSASRAIAREMRGNITPMNGWWKKGEKNKNR